MLFTQYSFAKSFTVLETDKGNQKPKVVHYFMFPVLNFYFLSNGGGIVQLATG